MTVEKAIDYVYASYLKAEPYLDYAAPDSKKRNPEYSREIIKKRAGAKRTARPDNAIALRKACHSEEPLGDEESPSTQRKLLEA